MESERPEAEFEALGRQLERFFANFDGFWRRAEGFPALPSTFSPTQTATS